MSYCRWSSDDFGCDLYCYEDTNGGWTTHVAGKRILGEVPHVDWSLLRSDEAEFWRQHEAQEAYLGTCERKAIGGQNDGATFNDGTLDAFKERLLMLQADGYRFPDYVLTSVDEEIAESGKAGG